MKLPVEWLKEFADFGCSVEELAGSLTMAGLEVEEVIERSGDELAGLGGEADGPAGMVFDVKVTPNRGDWLSVLGVARETAAILDLPLNTTEPAAQGSAPPASSAIKVSITAPDLCRRYAASLVRGVKIKESPGWLKNRLIMAGMRPINNVVDITNYVMLEYGQPLHAFDYSLLRGAEIIVRRAHPNETITTIDGDERALPPDTLVIADRGRAVAVAGVMGGSDTEVGESTKDVLIESANFDPVSIRRTSKNLGMSTESSYRFERTVDPSVTVTALKRAAELMRDLAEGEIAEGVVDVYPREAKPLELTMRPERAKKLLGLDIDSSQMARILLSLRMSVVTDETLLVTVPTFRADVTEEIDLIEEIARLHGFDKIRKTLPEAPLQGCQNESNLFEGRVRQILLRLGAQEVMTHSVVAPSFVEPTGLAEMSVVIRNPLREDLSRLRVMLAPNLLDTLSRNAAYGAKDLSIFEIGRVYRKGADGAITQNRSIGGAMIGTQWAGSWNLDKTTLDADFYLCKGAVESLLDLLGINDREFVPTTSPLLHPNRAAVVRSGERDLGILGEVAPSLRETFDLRGRPIIFELDFEALRKLAGHGKQYRPVTRYPALYRDLSVLIDADKPYSDVRAVIREKGGDFVESLELREVYVGPRMDPGKKSLLLSLAFRSVERTLTDQMVNDRMDAIREGLVGKLAAVIRGI